LEGNPLDKSPGPDGFNGLFMKKSWEIIKNDLIKLANDFYSGNMNLASINTAYITLIPKVNNPETTNEFRPISLASMPLKFITKLLANRLQKKSYLCSTRINMVSLKGKQFMIVLDGLLNISISAIYQKIMIIDFEQAFEKVEFNAIIAMCKALGIGHRFLSWITNILHTASTSILLNGVLGKKILCKRGESDKVIHSLLCSLLPLLSCYNISLIKHGTMVNYNYLSTMIMDRTIPSFSMQMTLY
jgi:hypothetical protein